MEEILVKANIIGKKDFQKKVGDKLHQLLDHVTEDERKEGRKIIAAAMGVESVSNATISRYLNNKVGDIKAAVALYNYLAPLVEKRQKKLLKSIK